jgi:exosortase/archaeosortase family protein
VLLSAVVYALTAVLFSGVGARVAAVTVSNAQLHLGFVILGFAGFWLIYENRGKLRLNLRHDRMSLGLLIGAYAGLGLSSLVGMAVPLAGVAVVLLAPCLAIASAVRFLYGPRALHVAGGLLGGFYAFLLLVAFLPLFDWPLRQVAGEWSLWLLNTLGIDARLALAEGRPMLILVVDGRPYHVAQECNGFGLLSASVLLTLLLSVYRRVGHLDKILLLGGAILWALFANAVRILGIVLIAPLLPFEQYQLMHDTVGIIVFYGALGALWWFIRGFGRDFLPPPQKKHKEDTAPTTTASTAAGA